MAGAPYALSIRQPWASLILRAGKDVENRAWHRRPSHTGPLLVHASKTYDVTAPLAARAAWRQATGTVLDRRALPTGAYLGVVTVTGAHHADECVERRGEDLCSPWAEPGDVYHLLLADPRPFPDPVPGPGRLGLWRPDAPGLVDALAGVT